MPCSNLHFVNSQFLVSTADVKRKRVSGTSSLTTLGRKIWAVNCLRKSSDNVQYVFFTTLYESFLIL